MFSRRCLTRRFSGNPHRRFSTLALLGPVGSPFFVQMSSWDCLAIYFFCPLSQRLRNTHFDTPYFDACHHPLDWILKVTPKRLFHYPGHHQINCEVAKISERLLEDSVLASRRRCVTSTTLLSCPTLMFSLRLAISCGFLSTSLGLQEIMGAGLTFAGQRCLGPSR